MKCAWNELLSILPSRLRNETDRLGRDDLQEIRLRLGGFPMLKCHRTNHTLKTTINIDDLHYIINNASRYSPWSAATISQGYITAQGGHRIGICGDAVMQNGYMTGVRNPYSLCIRVARDFPGIADKAAYLQGNILIIGPPGTGKTTLLRDLLRQLSKNATVCVVDERGEIFPSGFYRGENTDVLTGVDKQKGIECLLRTMGPTVIAVDEITSSIDCQALFHAGWCGVRLIATAHAGSITELQTRQLYQPILQTGLFQNFIVLHPDKSWHLERMRKCS